MIVVTEKQMQALEAGQEPLRVVNVRTGTNFVLMRQDVYEKLCKLVEEAEQDDPEEQKLELYQQYRKNA